VPSIPAQTREGTIELPDGRALAYVERGPEDGAPVIFHHGTPGSRAGHHPDPGVYAESGVRAVSYDRAGYGRSDRLGGRDVVDVVGDISVLADGLGFGRFAVMGVSGGGPHALACGALLPDRVTRAPNDDDFTRPWGFKLADVAVEVRMWHGELDRLAPRAHGQQVAKRLPNASFELVPGLGHMLYGAWGEALAWAAG
jgi:pimeloyl-ACP methyl ester carboxylesterase